MKKRLTYFILSIIAGQLSLTAGVRIYEGKIYVSVSDKIYSFNTKTGEQAENPAEWVEEASFDGSSAAQYAVNGEEILILSSTGEADEYGRYNRMIVRNGEADPQVVGNSKTAYMAQHPEHAEELVIMLDYKLFKSRNFGKTWEEISTPFPESNPIVDPEGSREIWNENGMEMEAIRGIEYHPYMENCLIMSTVETPEFQLAINYPYILWISQDGGESKDSYVRGSVSADYGLDIAYSPHSFSTMIVSSGKYSKTSNFWQGEDDVYYILEETETRGKEEYIVFDPEVSGRCYLYPKNTKEGKINVSVSEDDGDTWRCSLTRNDSSATESIGAVATDGKLYSIFTTQESRPFAVTFNLTDLAEIKSDTRIEETEGIMDIYSVDGIRVLGKAKEESIKNLPAGIYISNGRKFIVR